MKATIRVFFSVVILIVAGVQVAKAEQCKVTDPTGTPLNVRASPNGKILQTVKNGTIVYEEQTAFDSKNRAWVQISRSTRNGRKILGWVFREFISCYSTTTKEDWGTFISKFKTAVRNRDSAAVKNVMMETYDCRSVYFCFYIEPYREKYSNDFFLKQLSQGNSKGWKGLEKVLLKGKLWDTTDTNYKFIGLSTKLVDLPNNDCGVDFLATFQFKNNRWLFTGFLESSCH